MSVVLALLGLHERPEVGSVVAIVVAIAINLGVVFGALWVTAAHSSYVDQLRHGVLIGFVGGMLVCVASWLLLSFVFPNYLDEMRAGYAQWLESADLPQEQVEAQIALLEQATPLSQSLPGWIGTFFTSSVAAAILGLFLRKK
jgi:hypothetical protein